MHLADLLKVLVHGHMGDAPGSDEFGKLKPVSGGKKTTPGPFDKLK